MRRSLSKVLPVLLLSAFVALPAFSAPTRNHDSGPWGFLEQIVKIAKRAVHALEEASNNLNIPKP